MRPVRQLSSHGCVFQPKSHPPQKFKIAGPTYYYGGYPCEVEEKKGPVIKDGRKSRSNSTTVESKDAEVIENLRTRLGQLEEQKKTTEKEVRVIQNFLKEVKKEKEILDKQKSAAEGKEAKIRHTADHLRLLLESKEREIKELKERQDETRRWQNETKAKMKQTVEAAEGSRVLQETTISALQVERSQLKSQLDSITAQLEKANLERNQLSQQLQQNTTAKTQSEKEAAAVVAIRDNLLQERKSLEQQLILKEKRIAVLEAQEMEIKDKEKDREREKNKDQQTLRSMRERLTDLALEKTQLEQENRTLMSASAQLNHEYKRVEGCLSKAHERLKELEKKEEVFNVSRQNWKEQLNILRLELEQQREESAQSDGVSREMRSKIAALQRDKIRLEDEKEKFSEEKKSLVSQLQDSKHRLQELEKNLEGSRAVTRERDSWVSGSRLQAANDKILFLQQQNAELEDELRDVRDRSGVIEDKAAQESTVVAEAETAVNAMKETLAAQMKEIETMKVQRDLLLQQTQSLSARHEKLKQEQQKLTQSDTTLRDKNVQLVESKNTLEEQVEALVAQNQKLVAFKVRCEEAEALVNALKEKNETLLREKNELQERLIEVEAYFKSEQGKETKRLEKELAETKLNFVQAEADIDCMELDITALKEENLKLQSELEDTKRALTTYHRQSAVIGRSPHTPRNRQPLSPSKASPRRENNMNVGNIKDPPSSNKYSSKLSTNSNVLISSSSSSSSSSSRIPR